MENRMGHSCVQAQRHLTDDMWNVISQFIHEVMRHMWLIRVVVNKTKFGVIYFEF